MSVLKENLDDRPLLMGVLNVTPDSFSDGGRFGSVDEAVRYGLEMAENGADILDVGGESSRPGSLPVSCEEELARVIPVIEELVARTSVPVSVDTVKPEVAEAALAAGASMVNDVSNLRDGDALARSVARTDAFLILMHSRATPAKMAAAAVYEDVVSTVCLELQASVATALSAGVRRDRIWLDPGIGFAKTPAQSLQILGRLDEIVGLGYPVLAGPSRKSFIGEISGAPVHDRVGGTAAAVTACILLGARAVRVHDIQIMRQVVLIAAAVRTARSRRTASIASKGGLFV